MTFRENTLEKLGYTLVPVRRNSSKHKPILEVFVRNEQRLHTEVSSSDRRRTFISRYPVFNKATTTSRRGPVNPGFHLKHFRLAPTAR